VTSALVAETIAVLKEVVIFNSVHLVWVPGHTGISGNEKANVLAKAQIHYSDPVADQVLS